MREKKKIEDARRLIVERIQELAPTADHGQALWLAQALKILNELDHAEAAL